MKKKGFTLIELLAVILILRIIALIAIPVVTTIIDESKKGTFEAAVKNIEKKIEETCSAELIDPRPITSQYNIVNGKITPKVDIKGNLPNGTINLDNDW